MEISCIAGDSKNQIKGSEIEVRNNRGEVVDKFTVPTKDGIAYCEKHPTGRYGRRYRAALDLAKSGKALPTFRNPNWKKVDLREPPRPGNYWVSNGEEVWPVEVRHVAQIRDLVTMMGIKTFRPIQEEQPEPPIMATE